MMRWPTNGSFKGCVQRDLTRASPELLPVAVAVATLPERPGGAGGSWVAMGCVVLCWGEQHRWRVGKVGEGARNQGEGRLRGVHATTKTSVSLFFSLKKKLACCLGVFDLKRTRTCAGIFLFLSLAFLVLFCKARTCRSFQNQTSH